MPKAKQKAKKFPSKELIEKKRDFAASLLNNAVDELKDKTLLYLMGVLNALSWVMGEDDLKLMRTVVFEESPYRSQPEDIEKAAKKALRSLDFKDEGGGWFKKVKPYTHTKLGSDVLEKMERKKLLYNRAARQIGTSRTSLRNITGGKRVSMKLVQKIQRWLRKR